MLSVDWLEKVDPAVFLPPPRSMVVKWFGASNLAEESSLEEIQRPCATRGVFLLCMQRQRRPSYFFLWGWSENLLE